MSVTLFSLRRTNQTHPDFRALVTMLDTHLLDYYGSQLTTYTAHNVLPESVEVVLAYAGDEAVACGAFKRLPEPGMVEIKRMFVKPEHRRKGLSRAILSELEQWAKEENHHTSRLETLRSKTDAIALYQGQGYVVIPNYGPYADLPDSICLEKRLLSTVFTPIFAAK